MTTLRWMVLAAVVTTIAWVRMLLERRAHYLQIAQWNAPFEFL